MKSGFDSSRWARLKPWILGIAVVLLLVVSLLSFRLVSPDVSLDLDSEGTLVVLPVRNATGEPEHDWLRLGLTEMLAETLRRTSGIRVVEPERLIRTLRARQLEADDDETRRRVRELGRALGAELLLEVTATKNPGRGVSEAELYLFHFTVTDAADKVVGQGELPGSDPVRIADRLGYLVAGALASPSEPVPLNRVFSSSPFVNRLYGMGLNKLFTADAETSRPYFEIALATEPDFLAARLRLAECDRRSGRLQESRQRILEVIETSQNRGERVWEARALHALAVVEALDGNTDKAVELATQVRSLRAVKGDAGADLAALRFLARLSLAQEDDARSRQLYEEISQLQEQEGDRLGRVETLAQLGALALRTDDLGAAVQAFNEGRALAAEVDDVRTEMQLLASLGEVASRRGQRADAVELWRRAATFYEQRGEEGRLLLLKRNIAEALLLNHDLDAAEDAFHDLRELAIARHDEGLEALASLRLTFILLRRGYPYQARNHLDRAIELDKQLDQPLALQRMIAWMAYEESNFSLAVSTLTAVKHQGPESWTENDEEFLSVFSRALQEGRRLPVPGEDVLGPG